MIQPQEIVAALVWSVLLQVTGKRSNTKQWLFPRRSLNLIQAMDVEF